MNDFLEAFFDPEQILFDNRIEIGEEKYNVYVEDEKDIWFWECFIEKYYPKQYRVQVLGQQQGKGILKKHYHFACKEALIAVDSDFDYLCPNLASGEILHHNPYILHTFAYSKESVLLEKSYLQEFVRRVKHTISHEVDIDKFITKFSYTIYDGLIHFIYLKHNGINFNIEKFEENFHKCFDLMGKQFIIHDKQEKQAKVIIDESLLDTIQDEFNKFFSQYPLIQQDKSMIQTQLENYGLTKENAYRFISGHVFERLVFTILKQLTDELFKQEQALIKMNFQGQAIGERIKSLHTIFTENFQLPTQLRHYPICPTDEIHQKICQKIQAIP